LILSFCYQEDCSDFIDFSEVYTGETNSRIKHFEKFEKRVKMSYSFVCLIILGVVTGLSYGKSDKRKFISLFSLSILGAEPNWFGTYNISPLCDRQACCCLSGQVEVSEFAHFFMKISGKLEGDCNGLETFFLPAMKPSTYSTKLPIVGVVNLSEDSTTITVESPIGPQCNGRAVRQ
jgi:hypothetical protein